MDRKERFYATIERRPVDRPASWIGMPVPEALPALLDYFKVKDLLALKNTLNDDIWPIDVPFHCPPANHIACAFDFSAGSASDPEHRTLTTPGWFMDKTDPACIEEFFWPNPAEHMSFDECRKVIRSAPQDFAIMGVMWSAHFQDACAAFGMENALMTMLTDPEMFQAVIDRITEFYLQANEIFYEAGRGMMDAVLIGNDFGSQSALMVAPESLRKFVFPGTRRLIEQAHAYGYKVIHHSCGAIREIVPDLIGLGADAIHPIQALATGMDAKSLHDEWGKTASFCGGVDAQHLLVAGTPDQIRNKVHELRRIFPTGLIISPSHEAVLPDIPPANLAALFSGLNG
jgi:uroporphyrinogen decarboxylase